MLRNTSFVCVFFKKFLTPYTVASLLIFQKCTFKICSYYAQKHVLSMRIFKKYLPWVPPPAPFPHPLVSMNTLLQFYTYVVYIFLKSWIFIKYTCKIFIYLDQKTRLFYAYFEKFPTVGRGIVPPTPSSARSLRSLASMNTQLQFFHKLPYVFLKTDYNL